MKKHYSEEQIIDFLREAEAGLPMKDLCRRHGFSEASYYLWRSKFGGMSITEAKRLKELETENARLTIVDTETRESVAIEVERAISGQGVVRVLKRLAITRGLPRVIRTDNGKEFRGKAMLTWAHESDVRLRLIEPGKPNQNAYIESFNGRLRDECLNEHWFPTLRSGPEQNGTRSPSAPGHRYGRDSL